MSLIRTMKSFETKSVEIKEFNKKEITTVENSLRDLINEKIKKLKLVLSGANIYTYKGLILVNDRYNTCLGLEEVCNAFGLDVKPLETTLLKGKNYLLSDKLMEYFYNLDNSENLFLELSNKELNDELTSLILGHYPYKINEKLLAIVKEIKKAGSLKDTYKREVITSEMDGEFLGSDYGDWNLDSSHRTILQKLSEESKNLINNGNLDLQKGTTQLIIKRAMQMGYEVKLDDSKEEIALELVRIN